jgi:hypothetical protein
MTNVLRLSTLGILLSIAPRFALAEEALQDVANLAPETILNTYILVSTAAVGVIAAIIVIRTGMQMQGGIFGKALVMTGTGMVLIAGSYLMQGYVAANQLLVQSLASSLFLSGFALIGVAAGKIRKAIES